MASGRTGQGPSLTRGSTGAGADRLLHGDFHPRHVYADDDRVTAIIDWGDATAGDPDYDIARVLHVGLLRCELDRALAMAWAVLVPATRISDERLSKLLLYAAVFILWSMHGEFDNGAPSSGWWPIQVASLRRVLDALDLLA